MAETKLGTDWQAALAEIEEQIATLEAAAQGIRVMLGMAGPTTPRPTGGPGSGIKPDSFLKLSIPDATKKLLEMERSKQSTQDVMDALVKGGLPPSKYNTVYSILSRREKQVGDIINMKGDWALAEWYPNHRSKAKKESGESGKKDSEKEKATA